MSSAFDDLLNLDGPAPESTAPATTNNSDPFDMFTSGPPAANESTGNSGGGSNLLDFGFDAQISTDNGSSGKLNFEASSNPLYDFTHTDTKMESDSSNPLYELNNEPATQKEVKSEPSNLLYEYMQTEGQSNGHVEGGLTNGATENGVDLLGGSGDLLGDSGDASGTGSDLLGDSWANVSQGQVDLLGEGDSQNVVVDDKTDLLGDSEPTEDKPADLLIEPEPVVAEEPVVIEEDRPVETQPESSEPEQSEPEPEQLQPEPEQTEPEEQVQDTVVSEPGETTQARSRSSSESSVPEQDEDTAQVVKETEQIVETRQSEPEENALKVNGASEVTENGISEEDAVRDPDIYRETHEKDEIHFAEMNNVRQKFESGKTSSEEQTPKKISVKDEYDQGGEFENEPVRNPDVVREADQPTEELPEIGMAKNLVSRFKSISENKDSPAPKPRARSPARAGEKVEYESQPAEHLPQYEAKVESGVFESEPRGHEEEVVRAGDTTEDYKPEQGYAKNILNRFKEIETESTKVKDVSQKREITPDRSGKVEYVSEPRSERIEYNDVKSESGVFENAPKSEEDVVKSGDKADEVLPEAGYAKSLLSKFKQMESEVGHKPPPSPKRAISQDKSAKSEFVSEPKGYLERYEPQTESGEYENKPAERGEVIRSGEAAEEVLPEAGSAKKTMERFKEIQKQSSSPVSSSQRSKAMTPPRELSPGRTVSGVVENTPKARDDVIRSGEAASEPLPEQGSTRNILNKFKEIQTSGSQSSSPGKKPKEFTPPPESGVYENTPQEHLVVETRQSESGVLENTPSKSVADVAREREQTPEKELPEQGYAKNMVSKWKQLESSSGNSAKSTSSTSPRFKQFTPPRDSRGPMSPKSPVGVTNGVHPSELPGQYQPQESSVIVENNPEVMEGIYRESDTDWNAGMPAANTTASMLQKFKQIQSQAKESESSQAPVTRKS